MITPIEFFIILSVLTIAVDGNKSKFDFFVKLALIGLTVFTGVQVAQMELI